MGVEIIKNKELCKYYWEDKEFKSMHVTGVLVTFCMAIGKGRCTYDPHNYATCPNYIRYNKSIAELTPKTATVPRFPS